MKNERWKWALAAGAALAGGWTYEFPPCSDSSYVWYHRIDSIDEAYLAQHDTVAYMANVYGPKLGLYPEELKVPSSIVLYYSKVFAYGRVIRIEPFMDEGQEGRCVLYIEVEECLYGECGDTLRLFAAEAPAMPRGLPGPLEGDWAFVSGRHIPTIFCYFYKEARDSLFAGKIPDPLPGAYELFTYEAIYGDTTWQGHTAEEMKVWMRAAAENKRAYLQGKGR